MILNDPNCQACAGSTPGNAGVPPFYALDSGQLTLVSGVSQTVTFRNIKATTANQWAMPEPLCVNASGERIVPTITKSATGFTVSAYEACTFSYVCVKII